MKQRHHKILITIVAFLFSVIAACIGCSLVSEFVLTFGVRMIYNFFFIMQAIATLWIGIGLLKKDGSKV